jgi:purine-nucleoside phosphorylase
MIHREKLEAAADAVSAKFPDAKPSFGLILGSGWGDVVSSFTVLGEIPYSEIPGLGKTGVVGHAGKLLWAESHGFQTFIFQGRRHFYEGEGWTPPAIPPFILKAFGVSTVILTNAAGGIRNDLKPGWLMIVRDHINLMGSNPLIGPHNPDWGTRFPDQSHVYNAKLRHLLHHAGAVVRVPMAEGVYLASSGPLYETPSEIRMHRTLGADAVGMSTLPEAQLLSAAGIRVGALSCITNLAAGISPTPLTHEEVTTATRDAMPRMTAVIAQVWKELAHEQT